MFVDLHLHSTASDGILSPSRLVNKAKAKGLKAIAITDHDSISGIKEALEEGKKLNLEVIPGIELDVGDSPQEDIIEIDILGYFIDISNKSLISIIKKMNESKWKQKKETIKILQKYGIKITEAEVLKEAKGGLVGRPHIARVALRNNPDKFKDYDSVFKQFLIYGQPAHTDRDFELTMKEAIELIHKAKGLAFLAHPIAYIKVKNLHNLVKKFKEAGGDGIEVIYCYRKNKPYIGVPIDKQNELIEIANQLAEEFNLLKSGGSDFHDPKTDIIGEVKVPLEMLEKIKRKVYSSSSSPSSKSS
ncbi:PHP domain-containing protein [Candidatus Woesearchaeota archaeon]|nr:PHP domain-containing protein [Candidatus Woesearchaeota archaeon]